MMSVGELQFHPLPTPCVIVWACIVSEVKHACCKSADCQLSIATLILSAFRHVCNRAPTHRENSNCTAALQITYAKRRQRRTCLFCMQPACRGPKDSYINVQQTKSCHNLTSSRCRPPNAHLRADLHTPSWFHTSHITAPPHPPPTHTHTFVDPTNFLPAVHKPPGPVDPTISVDHHHLQHKV